MAFLEENCILDVLTDDILKECHPFVYAQYGRTSIEKWMCILHIHFSID